MMPCRQTLARISNPVLGFEASLILFRVMLSRLRLRQAFAMSFDTISADKYFINQRDANLTSRTVNHTLRPLKDQDQAFGSSDEILITGVPYGLPRGESPDYDTWQSIATRIHPDLVFVQMDPSAYIARQRFLAHKSALHEVDGYDKHDAMYLDPWKPYNWEECIVNNFVLDMLVQNTIFDKLDVKTGFASYAYPSIQKQEIREVNKGKLIDTITKHVVHRKFSPYYTINRVMYSGCFLNVIQALLTRHKVLLGDMPEHLLRIQIGNVLRLHEVRDLFKYVLAQTKQMDFPTSFRQASLDLLPHVFQAPRDLYMTAMLKRAFTGAQNIAAFIGIHHANPIKHYWQPPPSGINYTEATRIPDRINGETDAQLIEKQAILEVMLETTIWAEPYISNPFPYLVKDITKVPVSKEELEGMKKMFFDYYQQYNAFKLQAQKELPNFRNHSEIQLLQGQHGLLSLPGYHETKSIDSFKKYQEQQQKLRQQQLS